MVTSANKVNELAEQILTAARLKLTGTIRVKSTDEQRKQILVIGGYIADVDTGREQGVLETALIRTEGFSPKDLKRAQKTAAKQKIPIGVALLDTDLVPQEVVAEFVQLQLLDEICEVFSWDVESSDCHQHAEGERLEDFQSDLSDYLDVYLDGEEVFLEAARCLSDWELVTLHFDVLRDVFYATPSSFQYFKAQDSFPEEHAIIGAVDGIKDIEEVVIASGLDPFQALKIVRRLIASTELELVNPVQMYQLGVESAAADNHEKACRLFVRAHERGLDDFDLQLKMAQTFEALGLKNEAGQWYRQFAEKCLDQLRTDEAARALKKAVRFEPDNMDLREQYLSLVFQNGSREEAIDELVDLAERKASQGHFDAALSLLVHHQDDGEQDVKLQQKIIELAETAGRHDIAAREREALAKGLEQRKDVESALGVYQRMFCDGDDSIDVRLKLIELHHKSGNRNKALDHLQNILNLPPKQGVRDPETLRGLHETMRELRPADRVSNQWLVKFHSENGDDAQAANVLTEWIGQLERESESETDDLENAYQQLIALDDRTEFRWGLAATLERAGKLAEAQRELRSLANLSLRKQDYEQAMKALDYILKRAPFDIETRKMQAELYEAQGDRPLAAKKCKEIAFLDIVSGNVQEAEQFCRQVLVIEPTDAEMVTKLGELCEDSGDVRKAEEQYLKAGKIHFKNKNYGFCHAAVERLLKLDAGHAEGLALLEEVTAQLEGAATRSTVASPAAAVPAATTPAPTAPQGQTAAPAAAAALQVAASAPAPAAASSTPQKEFFQPPPPVVTTVSKSMARLRQLKSKSTPPAVELSAGETSSEGAPAQTSVGGGGRTATVSVTNVAAKLMAMKGGPAPVAMSAQESPDDNGAPPEAEATGSAPADPAATAPDPAQTTLPPADPTASAPKTGGKLASANAALHAAASRLKALAGRKGGGDDADGPGVTADATATGTSAAAGDASVRAQENTATPSDESPAPTTPQVAADAATDSDQNLSYPEKTEQVKPLKLGGAANRLAALRQAKTVTVDEEDLEVESTR